MAKKEPSAAKRSKKAGTQTRSTTSSTTAKRPVRKRKTKITETNPDTGTASISNETSLTGDQQTLLLELLLRGASPAAACQQIGVSLNAVNRTVADDETFRSRVREIDAALSQNVAAALYRAAMEGSVSAQTAWLKLRPPPGWLHGGDDADAPASFDEIYSGLTNDELVELARAMGVELPPEIERTHAASGG